MQPNDSGLWDKTLAFIILRERPRHSCRGGCQCVQRSMFHAADVVKVRDVKYILYEEYREKAGKKSKACEYIGKSLCQLR